MSATITRFLEHRHIPYEMVEHMHTATSLQNAKAAHVDPHRVAKAVLLEGDDCMMVAVVPADRRVHLGKLAMDSGKLLHLAQESDAGRVFEDCEPGAIPALTVAYGVEMIWDDSLLEGPDLYFESGDHKQLIHVKTEDLRPMLENMPHGMISKQMI